MLLLARKLGEEIIVECTEPCTFRIVFSKLDFRTIRLGFTAPESVKFVRAELIEGPKLGPTALRVPPPPDVA